MGRRAGRGPLPKSWPPPDQALVTRMSGGAGGAAAGAALANRRPNALGGERRPLEGEAVAVGRPGAQQGGAGGESRLGGNLRPADPGELGGALDPAAAVEERPVHLERHAVGAQQVGDLDREPPRDRRPPDPRSRDRPAHHLEPGPLTQDALADQVVEAELVGQEELDVRTARSTRLRSRTLVRTIRRPSRSM